MNSKVILERLKIIEKKHKVRILYAVESGSRAWGIESRDSDFDIRFIYVQEKDWYLSIEPRKDVIEIPTEGLLDINGWDLIKALGLFRKSNPPFYEWLQSPVVYIEPHEVVLKLRELVSDSFSPRACIFHYLSMAENNRQDYIAKADITSKKYFYVLRPVFACEWIKKFGTMPPVKFYELFEKQKLNDDLRGTVVELLGTKVKGKEKDLRPRIKLLDNYLDERIAYFTSYAHTMGQKEDLPYEPLNRLFRKALLDN